MHPDTIHRGTILGRPQRPVKPELTDSGMAAERFWGHLPRRRQQRECDRQVESGSFLAQLGRGEVDRDARRRPLELRGRDPAAHAVLRLLAGSVGEPGDREPGDAVLDVGLDVDAARVEPDQGVGDGSCEHVVNLDNEACRVCYGRVTKL